MRGFCGRLFLRASLQRFSFSLVVSFLLLSIGKIFGQTPIEPLLFDQTYYRFYEPEDFFNNNDYQNTEASQPKEFAFLQRMVNFLQAEGIAILVGEDANLQGAFDLYSPFIHHSARPHPVSITGSENSEVGFLYMDYHDTAHLYAGIPGPRPRDLQRHQEARDQLIRILLKKEQFATSWSFIDFIEHYWNWRYYQRDGGENPDFQTHNRNIYSGTRLSRKENVEAIGHMVHGEFKKYTRLLFRSSSAQEVRAAREAGVPLAGPTIYKRFGHFLEKNFYRWLVPLLEPAFAYVRKGGYKSFLAYSELTADSILQDWYADWAADFEFGMPLDQMEAHVDALLEDMKANRPVGPSQTVDPQSFPLRFFKVELQILGRKIAEAKEVIQKKNKGFELQSLQGFYSEVLEIHNLVRKKIEDGDLEFETEASEGKRILLELERLFPGDELLDLSEREAFMNYKNFWRNPTGLLLPRFGADNAAGAPDPRNLKSFHKRRRLLQQTRLGRFLYKHFAQLMFPNSPGGYVTKPHLRSIEGLVDAYDRAQETTEEAPDRVGEASYAERFELWLLHLNFQIHEVAIPQIVEMPHLHEASKKEIIQQLESFATSIQSKGEQILEKYTQLGRPNGELAEWEFVFTNEVDRGMEAVADLLNAIEKKQRDKKINRALQRIEVNSSPSFRSSHEISAESTLKRNLSIITPTRTKRLYMLWKFIKDFRFGINPRPLAETLHSIPWSSFLRNQQAEPLWSGFSLKDFKPEENAIYVVAFNHEHALVDGKIGIQISKDIEAQSLKVLTTRGAWPQFTKNSKKDESLVFIQSSNFYRDIVEAAEKTKGRFVLTTAPEGLMPFWHTQAPLMAKAGVFTIARKLAHAFEGKRKVYLIEVRSNGLANITGAESEAFQVEVREPKLVPSEPVGRSDSWITRTRRNFENWINESRGLRQIDLLSRERDPETGLYKVGRPQSYLSFVQWHGGKAFQSCLQQLKQAIQASDRP